MIRIFVKHNTALNHKGEKIHKNAVDRIGEQTMDVAEFKFDEGCNVLTTKDFGGTTHTMADVSLVQVV